MDSRHVVNLGVKLIVDVTSVVSNPDNTQEFSVKVYNNSSFFLIEFNPELLKQVFGKNTTLEITEFHSLISNFFQNSKEIAHFFVKRIVKLKYGDNFTLKVQGSKKAPDPEVDKLVLHCVSDFQNQHMDFWLILPEQFNRGPSTSEVMKDVEFLRAMVRTSMKENVGLKKEMKELELKLTETNQRNDEQDRIFKEAMSSNEAENQKLVELINQNKKDNNDLRKTIEYTRKELEVCTVDVSILLSSISNLKDKIQFLLQILQKKRQEVAEGPPPPGPSPATKVETTRPPQQQMSEASSTASTPSSIGSPSSQPNNSEIKTISEEIVTNGGEVKQQQPPEETETPGEEVVDPAVADLDFPDIDKTVKPPTQNESISGAQLNIEPNNNSTTTTEEEEKKDSEEKEATEVEKPAPEGSSELSNDDDNNNTELNEEEEKLRIEREAEERLLEEEEAVRLKHVEEEEEEKKRLEKIEEERKRLEEDEKQRKEDEIQKKRELEEKRRKELDEKRKKIERERQARLLELKKKREKEREQRKQRLLMKKKEVLNSIRAKPLGTEGLKQAGGMGAGGGGTPEGRRFVPNRGESKFSRSRKNNVAVVLEKGILLGRTGEGGFGNASLNKVVARGEHEWKLKYICPEKKDDVTTYMGIYDPTKVKFEKIPPINVGNEDLEKSYGLNVRNGKLYHLGQEVRQILPETGMNNGDILHICVNLTDGALSFKLNGVDVGSKVEGIKGPLSPAVSLGSQGEKVSVVNDE